MNKEKRKIELIKIHLEEAIDHFQKTKSSFRWKIGHAISKLIERLLFRKAPHLSIDKLEAHLQAIQRIAASESNTTISSFPTFSFNASSKILFLVSDEDINRSLYGDTHVAYDLKVALEDIFQGINCKLINQENSIDYNQWDITISMLWNTDLKKEEKDKTISIAWIRNYPERWVANPNFINYDLVLCSSKKIQQYINEHCILPNFLFPIAANIKKFQAHEKLPENQSICFVGNKWKEKRQIESIIENPNFDFNIYGQGWDKNKYGESIKGPVSNKDISQIYRDNYIILDTANETTTNWESLNSRVFNSIASKRLLLTDSEAASKLFKYPIPVFSNPKNLADKLHFHVDSTKKYKQIVNRLHKELHARHTYYHRVNSLKLLLGKKINIAIKIAPTDDKKSFFGDYYFAQELKESLEYYHHQVRIDCYDNWYTENASNDDLVIVLRGLQAYKPLDHQINILWLISHPKLVSEEEIKSYHFSFIASDYHTELLKEKGISQVAVLHQCTNNMKFKYLHKKEEKKQILLFVGNSRNVFRKSVQYALELGFEIHVYGSGWQQFIDNEHIKKDFISNKELYQLYNTYDIILNDHWEDMLEYGYLSNRVFDTAACGAQILSDQPINTEGILTGIHYYNDKASFKEKIDFIRSQKTTLSSNYYEVNNYHTFDKRAKKILNQYYILCNEIV